WHEGREAASMDRSFSRRALVVFGLLLATIGLGAGGGSWAAAAQESAIACAPATPAASPTAAMAAASPVAAPAAFPAGGGQLTVFAAASLTDAFGKMKSDLEAAHPG